jgi:hypothetical protein
VPANAAEAKKEGRGKRVAHGHECPLFFQPDIPQMIADRRERSILLGCAEAKQRRAGSYCSNAGFARVGASKFWRFGAHAQEH